MKTLSEALFSRKNIKKPEEISFNDLKDNESTLLIFRRYTLPKGGSKEFISLLDFDSKNKVKENVLYTTHDFAAWDLYLFGTRKFNDVKHELENLDKEDKIIDTFLIHETDMYSITTRIFDDLDGSSYKNNTIEVVREKIFKNCSFLEPIVIKEVKDKYIG